MSDEINKVEKIKSLKDGDLIYFQSADARAKIFGILIKWQGFYRIHDNVDIAASSGYKIVRTDDGLEKMEISPSSMICFPISELQNITVHVGKGIKPALEKDGLAYLLDDLNKIGD